MKDLRYFRYFAPVLAIAMMTGVAFAAAKGSRKLKMPESVSINGSKLAAGEYSVSWVTHSPEATVTFEKGRDVVATTEGKWEDRTTQYEQNSVVLANNPDGTHSVVEIRFAGMKGALVFGG